MQVQLNHFVPDPLAETLSGASDLWMQSNVDIAPEKLNIVVSASGKGKTSLISSIYGLRKDYHGRIFLDGRDIKRFSPEDWATVRQKRLSIVFQNFRLFPSLSALENIELKNSLTAHKSEDEIKAMLEKLGLESVMEQSAGTLSLGQQQRLAIVRALCQPFTLILLDEPFSHLDPENSNLAFNMIMSEAEKQKAKVLITALHKNDIPAEGRIFNL